MDANDVSIKDIIRRISNELLDSAAQREADGDAGVFAVDSMDIELNFVVTRTTSGHAGVDIKVVSVGGQAEFESQQVQRITVHLEAASKLTTEERDDPFRFIDIDPRIPQPVLPRRRHGTPGDSNDSANSVIPPADGADL